MTFRGILKKVFVWLLCISLCLGLAVPALAEDATGSEIRLLQTEGTVNVTSTSGKSYSTREDMRLYNGYVVSTEEASYAWITLDSDKAVKLDQCSSLEVRRSGKTLELLLKSGELFFNVTAPLKEDEKLNIRTSTMVTGVRGTAGWIKQLDLDHSEVGILEGQVVCHVINPETGASRTLVVKSGQVGELWIYDSDTEGEGAEAHLKGLSMDDIAGYILEEILKDPELQARILEGAGFDFSGLTSEQVSDKLAAEQEAVRQKLKEIVANMLEDFISKDPLWEGGSGGDGAETYTITWHVLGQAVTTTCAAGATPYYAPPEVEGFVFDCWSPAIVPAAADAVYTANYKPLESGEQPEPPVQYTVTWIVDGVSTQRTYSEGATPMYPYGTPYKMGFEFKGWDPVMTAVTGDAEYTAIFEPIKTTYSVYLSQSDNGTLEAVTAAEEGDTVAVTVTPDEGYEVVEVFISYEVDGTDEGYPIEGTDGKYTFVMPAADVTVEAMFTEISGTEGFTLSSAVDPAEAENVQIRFLVNDAEAGEAQSGDTVTAEVTWPGVSYTLVSAYVTWTDETGAEGEPINPTLYSEDSTENAVVRTYTFDMPAGDATFTAVFEPAETYYNVYLIQPQNGTLDAAASEAAEGSTVRLTVTPDPGYDVTEVFVMYELNGVSEERSIESTNGEYSFEMPAADVTVEAAFTAQTFTLSSDKTPAEAENVEILFQVNNTEASEAKTGDTVTVKVAWPSAAYTLTSAAVTWTDGTGADGEITPTPGDSDVIMDGSTTRTYTFTMPAGDATFAAVFDTHTYTITWKAETEGEALWEEDVAYGEIPEYGGEEPTKASDDQFRYVFNGTWSSEIVPAEMAATYIAQFDSIPLYAIDLQPDKGGTLKADATDENGNREIDVAAAAEGDTVTVTVTADPGYDVTDVFMMYELDGAREERRLEGTDGTYTFDMPAAEVRVEARFAAQTFTLTSTFVPEDVEEAWITLTVNGDEADAAQTGDTVTVQLEWFGESYRLDSVIVNWTDSTGAAGTPITPDKAGEDNTDGYITRTYTFEMPAGNADVSAFFSQRYFIQTAGLTDYANVSVIVGEDYSESAVKGDTVTVTMEFFDYIGTASSISPVASYYDSDTDSYVPVTLTSTGENSYQFTMPENSVMMELSVPYTVTVEAENAKATVTSSTGVEASSEGGLVMLLLDSTSTISVHVIPVNDTYEIKTTDGTEPFSSQPEVDFQRTSPQDVDPLNESTFTFDMPDAELLHVTITLTQG